MYFDKGLRCANHRDVNLMVAAIVDEFLLKNCVGKVCAIPRQKIVDLVDDCEGKMRGVCRCFVGKLEKLNDVVLQTLKSIWNIKRRNTFQRVEPLSGKCRIASTRFRQRENGCENAESAPLSVPPKACRRR